MPRFATMIAKGMQARGHTVEVWTPEPLFYHLPVRQNFKKWLGYLDQFIVFPQRVRSRLKRISPDTVFVFSDQALGPWVPLVAKRHHAVHVHDFMALRSALGEYVQNPVGWSGWLYQKLIQRGFAKGRRFVSVSENTKRDLHRFLLHTPTVSEVVYNGLNFPFRRMNESECSPLFASAGVAVPESGYLLHVGGNQWYKNRQGVLEIYEAYVHQDVEPLPLWMIGAPPTAAMKKIVYRMNGKGKVRFITNFTDAQVCAAYSTASLLLFPSIAEGFGWPIAEGMACGCPVLTTGEVPMTEVGGDAAYYIPRRPSGDASGWAIQAGKTVVELLGLSVPEKETWREKGFKQVANFDTQRTLDAYEAIYSRTLEGA
jgi:glycosyltransferase involved in cell wall biosynthesis